MSIYDVLQHVIYIPHPEVHQGELILDEGEISISPGCFIDLTGSVSIGEYTMIGEGTRILTHDHWHEGRQPLLLLQKEKGVKWQDKIIQDDVWLHSCIVLYQVTLIPTGTVVGIGSVLTHNPEAPYGIYIGNPARRIKER